MRHDRYPRINAAALLALLAVPLTSLEQERAQAPGGTPQYTLIDVGTLGGPNSSFQGEEPVVNDAGVATGWADTGVVDPDFGIVFHAFRWERNAMTDLGALVEGAFSGSQAISPRGVVVGFSTTGVTDPVYGPDFVATLWQRNNHIVDLGTLGGAHSIASAINDRGQVVGNATNTIPDPNHLGAAVTDLPAATQWRAALWQNGTIRDLGTLGEGTVASAFFVNARGQVAGVSTTDSTLTVFGIPTLHPFFWKEGAGMVDVGALGGVYASASSLNNRGQVVGFSTTAGDETNHAFLWDDGTLQDLGTMGGTQSAANSINDEGEIVGEAYPVDDHVHAFFWKKGVMTDLGTVSGCEDSNAYWINSRGQAVGSAFGCDGSDHAVLWNGGPPAIDLNSLVPASSNLFLVEAVSISDRGEIAALGVLPNGDTRGVLLVPKHDDDSVENAESATAAEISSRAARAPLTSQRLSQLRARLGNRGRFGLPLSNRVH